MKKSWLPVLGLSLLVSACAQWPAWHGMGTEKNTIPQASRPASPQGQEVVLYSLGLLETGYRFGGKNPEAGLDCSGMVSYVFEKAVGKQVKGSAADIAKRGRSVERDAIQPGDLVFFNTSNRPYSHVGIYIGEQRFIHAPSSKGKVRIERLDNSYFAQRFEEARTYFD